MVATETDARNGEYVTYAPKGEKCAACREPFRSLDRVRRFTVDRPTGPPAYGPYKHYPECPAL